MAQWADVSITTHITHVDLDERPVIGAVSTNDIETRCPMCRTEAMAKVSRQLEKDLKEQYPKLYALRAAEEEASSEYITSGGSVEILTIYIGNEHRFIQPSNHYPAISTIGNLLYGPRQPT